MPTLTYRPLARKVRDILEEAIAPLDPQPKIDITSVRKRVHAVIVSEAFNGRTEREKQNLVWDALEARLDPEELQSISAILTFGLDELR